MSFFKAMNKKNPNKITIILTDRELEILSYLQIQEGTSSLPSVVHNCIFLYHKLAYVDKQYMKKKKDIIDITPSENLTDEQKCEKAGGKIITENGILKCRLPQNEDGSMFLSFPI